MAVERHLIDDATLTASYIQTRGIKLWTATDMSLASTPTTETYTIDDANGTAVGTYSTLIWTAKTSNGGGRAYQVDNEGQSKYRALAAQLRKRFSHGLSAGASYTWSHAFDDMSGPPVVAFIPSNTAPGNYVADRARSSFDQRQRAVVNWTWQPTVTGSQSAVARYLLNGWQVSTIATMGSSLPETPLVLVNGQQFTSAKVTMAYTTSLNGSGGWSRAPFEPVNSLSLGPRYTVDARLSRTLPFTERVKGTLMFEAFNASNTQFDTSVNNIAYTATSGVLKPVPGFGTPDASWGTPFGTNARHCQVALRVVF